MTFPITFTAKTKSVVIGGTSGIGKAVANALRERLGDVEIAGRSTGLDVTSEAAVATYFEALGPVDHVVMTAGSSAPGGAGAFELALCTMLPTHATAEIIAAILAFRLVYYLLPAVLAGLCLCWPALTRLALNATNTASRADDPQALSGSAMRPASHLPHNRPIAEAAVIWQNGGHIHAFGLNQVALVDSPQASIALFGAVSGHLAEVLPGLRQHAKLRNAVACLYKCTARDAAMCRRARWRVLRIARMCGSGSRTQTQASARIRTTHSTDAGAERYGKRDHRAHGADRNDRGVRRHHRRQPVHGVQGDWHVPGA